MTPVKPFFCAIRLLRPLAILILVCNVPAWGQQEKALYSFRFNGSDGFGPAAGLVSDGSGNLYGTTTTGGAQNYGTIFEMSPPSSRDAHWTEAILFSFEGGGNGAYPSGTLVFDRSGNLYGNTSSGGFAACLSGCGTAFELSPPANQGGTWSHTVLYRFSPSRGDFPLSGVVLDESGNLYGTTPIGGPAGFGAVFKLIRPSVQGGTWSEKTIYTFAGASDGASPQGGLVFGKNHDLYGTSQSGGSSNNGTVFELTPPSQPDAPWTKTTLYSFLGGNDGSGLDAGVVLDAEGNLYGTTVQGGGPVGTGTVFQLVPPATQGDPWTEVILYAFQAEVGAFPYDAPARDRAGNLYGTTYEGGPHNVGIVFKLSPPAVKGGAWTFVTLHDFTGGGPGVDEGAFPFAGLILGPSGILYGTTSEGGVGACQTDIYYGCGTVFKVTP